MGERTEPLADYEPPDLHRCNPLGEDVAVIPESPDST